MVHLKLNNLLAFFVKKGEFLPPPGSGFLSHREMTSVVESDEYLLQTLSPPPIHTQTVQLGRINCSDCLDTVKCLLQEH